MSQEIIKFLFLLKNDYGFNNIISKIPDFINIISNNLEKKHLRKLGEDALSNCPKWNYDVKKDAIDFAELIWDIAPNILRFKLISLIYLSKYVDHNLFNFILVSGTITHHRYIDNEFDKKIKTLLNGTKLD